jgi:[acyl-carrier-protein] S-malonyltransferase
MSEQILAGLFPGQGSQSVGMGAAFAEQSEQARELFERADKALGYSISELCFKGPIEELTLTQNAQPALLTLGYLAYSESDIKVNGLAGHSLGEYTALVAAESLSFEDAVQLVHKRGRYMQEAVPEGRGKMLAVIKSSVEDIKEAISEVTSGVVEVANYNSPGQTVVAGDVEGIDAFATAIAAKGGKVIPLQVSAPFHCSLMKPAAEQLSKDLQAITFATPKLPVYANVTAAKIESGEEACELLKQQVCSSVRWTESMQNMISELGIQAVVEFGPGGVLSKLMKRIDSSVKGHSVDSPESCAATSVKLAA